LFSESLRLGSLKASKSDLIKASNGHSSDRLPPFYPI
jgi:hypothetical protein